MLEKKWATKGERALQCVLTAEFKCSKMNGRNNQTTFLFHARISILFASLAAFACNRRRAVRPSFDMPLVCERTKVT